MKKIVILALEDLFDSALAVTLDILKSARQVSLGSGNRNEKILTVIAGIEEGKIRTGAGLELQIDKDIDQIKSADYIIIPGLGISDPDHMESLLNSNNIKKTVNFLALMHNRGATITASCSATFLLAEAGLFRGKTATTSWWLSGYFRTRYPDIDLQTDRLIHSNSGVICAGAAMAQADLMMIVIAQVYSDEVARLTANYLLIDRREYQSQYVMSGMLSQHHPEVAKAERWVRGNISREFTIGELAKAIGVSQRTLARRIENATGAGPIKFVQQLRLETAIHLLETTSMSFETITAEVGYMDTSTLRRLLQQHTGKTPKQFRTR